MKIKTKKLVKGFFSKVLIIVIVGLNLWFTATVLGICRTGFTIPDSLIYAWFGFTTGELAMLFGVKKQKIKAGENYEKNRLDSETYQP